MTLKTSLSSYVHEVAALPSSGRRLAFGSSKTRVAGYAGRSRLSVCRGAGAGGTWSAHCTPTWSSEPQRSALITRVPFLSLRA
jgi:hypothetical protein